MSRTIYLVRHTTPKIEPGHIYGQTDLDIVEESFSSEVEAIVDCLPQLKEIPLYCSPLQRCRKLGEALGGAELQFDPRIKEMYFGDWEMKKWKDIDAQVLKNWMKNIAHEPTPKGESNGQLKARVLNFWEDLLETDDRQELGIVAHYGVFQSLLSHLLHIPIEKSFRLDFGYGAIIRVHIQANEFFKIKFLK